MMDESATLEDRAYRIELQGGQQLVIEDEPLLEWAARSQVPPWKAQVEALRRRIIPLRYLKNFGGIAIEEQIRICEAQVLICGCGGLGGILVSLMARAGVGRLRLADGDVFVPTNLNRQLLCDTQKLSREKARVAADTARAINPLLEVQSYTYMIDESNIDKMISGMDVVLDALDNLQGRFVLAAAARRSGASLIHAAVSGWWGQVSTFLPGSGHDLKRIYGERQSRDSTEESMGVLGPAAALIGSLEALEALRLLTGKSPAYASRLLYFDGETGLMEIMPI